MRFKIRLKLQPEVMGRELPINYQYPLQGVIYHLMEKADAQFSAWLHENGFKLNGKRFKLFTYSNLIVPKFGIDKERERLIIYSDEVILYVSFLPEQSTQKFVQGLFQQQSFQVADRVSGVQFLVKEIQVMTPLTYSSNMVFNTLSPICISLRNERGHMDYLSPEDPRYELGILSGLLDRYNTIYGYPFSGGAHCQIQLLSKPKSSLVSIKSGTPQATKVRGYRYQFKINLPEELMQIAYESGLGEKGSMGFGMIEEN